MKKIIKEYGGINESRNGVDFNTVSFELINALREKNEIELIDFGFNLTKGALEEKQFYISKDSIIKEEYTDRIILKKELDGLIKKYSKDCFLSVYYKD